MQAANRSRIVCHGLSLYVMIRGIASKLHQLSVATLIIMDANVYPWSAVVYVLRLSSIDSQGTSA